MTQGTQNTSRQSSLGEKFSRIPSIPPLADFLVSSIPLWSCPRSEYTTHLKDKVRIEVDLHVH